MRKEKDFCPRCQSLQSITAEEEYRDIHEENGRREVIVTDVYHCDSCHVYVKSQSHPEKYSVEQSA